MAQASMTTDHAATLCLRFACADAMTHAGRSHKGRAGTEKRQTGPEERFILSRILTITEAWVAISVACAMCSLSMIHALLCSVYCNSACWRLLRPMLIRGGMWDTCGPCIDWYTFLPRPLPPLPRPRPLPRPLAEVVLRAGLPLTAALAGDLGVSAPPCGIAAESDADQPNRQRCRYSLRHMLSTEPCKAQL